MIIKQVQAKGILGKCGLSGGGWSANPYVGCPHACKYCYAKFMARYTHHAEPWGEFLDVKTWPVIKNLGKYAGQRIFISTVTDPYNPFEAVYGRTRLLLTQLKDSGAKLSICTKSDYILRDLDLLADIPDITITFSINTLDENFRADMDKAASIERRLAAMQEIYNAGLRTICFIAPIFPCITDALAIIERVKSQCDYVWLDGLNLSDASARNNVMAYIANKRPELVELYNAICQRHAGACWRSLDEQVRDYAAATGSVFVKAYASGLHKRREPPVIVSYL